MINTHQSFTTKDVGALGEKVALRYLNDKGYETVTTNYWRNGSEIDLIVKKKGIIHFVEVKTVSHETKVDLENAVSQETWQPEELVHRFKLQQIARTIEGWILEHDHEGDWVIDVVAVRVVPRETFASVKFLENITV